MKIYVLNIFIFLLILNRIASGNPVPDSTNAEDSKIYWGIETDLNDKYLWRGITYDKGFVIQPNIWISYRNVTFSVWNNIPAYSNSHLIRPNEIDLSLSYQYSFLNCDVENSIMIYHYPHQSDSPSTGEFYVGIGVPVGELKWVTNLTADIMKYPGAFFIDNGMEFEEIFTEKFNLTLSLNTGWASKKFNETYIGISKTTLNIISAKLSSTYYPTSCFYIQPHLQLNKIIDKDLYEVLNNHSHLFGLVIGIEL